MNYEEAIFASTLFCFRPTQRQMDIIMEEVCKDIPKDIPEEQQYKIRDKKLLKLFGMPPGTELDCIESNVGDMEEGMLNDDSIGCIQFVLSHEDGNGIDTRKLDVEIEL